MVQMANSPTDQPQVFTRPHPKPLWDMMVRRLRPLIHIPGLVGDSELYEAAQWIVHGESFSRALDRLDMPQNLSREDWIILRDHWRETADKAELAETLATLAWRLIPMSVGWLVSDAWPLDQADEEAYAALEAALEQRETAVAEYVVALKALAEELFRVREAARVAAGWVPVVQVPDAVALPPPVAEMGPDTAAPSARGDARPRANEAAAGGAPTSPRLVNGKRQRQN
jgi:hypothetical protein